MKDTSGTQEVAQHLGEDTLPHITGESTLPLPMSFSDYVVVASSRKTCIVFLAGGWDYFLCPQGDL